MDLSIIIVNWNTRELTRRCLASISANPPAADYDFEVIVVDNGSIDGSVEMIVEEFPEVKIITNTKNTGYVRANNQGINWSHGDYILLLNSDTEVLLGTLNKMINFMAANPAIGISGCKLLNNDKTLQLSVRHFPTLWDQLVILTKLHNFFPKLIKKYLCFDFDYSIQQEVDQVMGAFMLIRREVIDQIGVLDKNIYSWFEDADYCYRAKQAGWKVVYTPIAAIVHLKGQSFAQQLALPKQKVLVKSLLYYFKKHHGILSCLVLLPFASLSLVLAWGVQVFGIKKKNKQL